MVAVFAASGSAGQQAICTLDGMSERHSEFCDGRHSERQACNDALAGSGSSDDSVQTLALPQRERRELEGPAIIEAPATSAHPAPSPLAEPPPSAPEPDATALRTTSERGMPTPSPWAVRAWEDTAAAVGAGAPPAQVAREPLEAQHDEDNALMPGHLPLIAGLAGATVLAILVAKRRRR
jgi:hypothetical protein